MPKVWYNINSPLIMRPDWVDTARFNLDREAKFVYIENVLSLGANVKRCPECRQIVVSIAPRGIGRIAFWRRDRLEPHATWRDGAEHKYPARVEDLKWCEG